jgi:hypothetical protein
MSNNIIPNSISLEDLNKIVLKQHSVIVVYKQDLSVIWSAYYSSNDIHDPEDIFASRPSDVEFNIILNMTIHKDYKLALLNRNHDWLNVVYISNAIINNQIYVCQLYEIEYTPSLELLNLKAFDKDHLQHYESNNSSWLYNAAIGWPDNLRFAGFKNCKT